MVRPSILANAHYEASPTMPNERYEEALTKELVSLRQRLLAGHQKELNSLQRVIDSLQQELAELRNGAPGGLRPGAAAAVNGFGTCDAGHMKEKASDRLAMNAAKRVHGLGKQFEEVQKSAGERDILEEAEQLHSEIQFDEVWERPVLREQESVLMMDTDPKDDAVLRDRSRTELASGYGEQSAHFASELVGSRLRLSADSSSTKTPTSDTMVQKSSNESARSTIVHDAGASQEKPQCREERRPSLDGGVSGRPSLPRGSTRAFFEVHPDFKLFDSKKMLMRKRMSGELRPVGDMTLTPPGARVTVCPGGCGFQVTWHETHCCSRCASGYGHSDKCDKLQRPQQMMNHVPSELVNRQKKRSVRMEDQYWLSVFIEGMMIQPSSIKHLAWELLGLALIVYDVIVIPVDLVFEPSEDTWILFMSWLSRFFWLLDIFKNFFTGQLQDQGTVEVRFQKVSRRYVLSWFPLDFLCVLVDWVTATETGKVIFRPISGSLRGTLRSIRILRVAKLMRVLKAPEIGKFIAEHIRSDMVILVASIFANLTVLILLAHFIACFWYWVGSSKDHGWVRKHIPDADSVTVADKYTVALHWSLAQFTGENVFVPENATERSCAVTILIFCFLAAVVFAAGITTSMTRLMMVWARQASQLSMLRRYLFDHNISTSLSVRMQRNGQHLLLEQRRHVAESSVELLRMISEPLRRELHFELYHPCLYTHAFFHQYGQINLVGVGMICHQAVVTLNFSPGDVVFNDCENAVEDESRNGMLWLIRGRLCYIQGGSGIPEDNDYTFMERGEWACEAALWTRWMHCGTLRAEKSTCTLLALNAKEFRRVLSTTPVPQVTEYATSFVKELNNGGHSSHTDLTHNSIVETCVTKAFPEYTAEAHQHDVGPRQSVKNSIAGASHLAMPSFFGKKNVLGSQGLAEFRKVQVKPAELVIATPSENESMDSAQTFGSSPGDVPSSPLDHEREKLDLLKVSDDTDSNDVLSFGGTPRF